MTDLFNKKYKNKLNLMNILALINIQTTKNVHNMNYLVLLII